MIMPNALHCDLHGATKIRVKQSRHSATVYQLSLTVYLGKEYFLYARKHFGPSIPQPTVAEAVKLPHRDHVKEHPHRMHLV
jgi:hypothetical protein